MAALVFLGLSLSSSWGNGHATTYRALLRALARRGHDILFLERDVPWYAQHRDLKQPSYCRLALYESLPDLEARFAAQIRNADAVIVGSYVPDGIAVGSWVLDTAAGRTAFYDIDTPETLAALERGDCTYLSPDLIRRYGTYLSFTGGPTLERLCAMGSPFAALLYCSADPDAHRPVETALRWTLGYLGTYSPDRQGPLEQLLLEPARSLADEQFVVAGAQYPEDVAWPQNVQHIPHLPPDLHGAFYSAQRFTLNVTRQAMRALGYSPSVRLFEAAACGTPIISDAWTGLETIFKPNEEILIAESPSEVVHILTTTDEHTRLEMAAAARRRVLTSHTSAHRAEELEQLLKPHTSRCDQVFAVSV